MKININKSQSMNKKYFGVIGILIFLFFLQYSHFVFSDTGEAKTTGQQAMAPETEEEKAVWQKVFDFLTDGGDLDRINESLDKIGNKLTEIEGRIEKIEESQVEHQRKYHSGDHQ